MEFIKGYQLEDGTTILEDEVVTVVNVQGLSCCGRLQKPRKKEFRLKIEGELEPKVFEVKGVSEIFKGAVEDCGDDLDVE